MLTTIDYLVELNGYPGAVIDLTIDESIRDLFADTTCDNLLISSIYCHCGDDCFSLSFINSDGAAVDVASVEGVNALVADSKHPNNRLLTTTVFRLTAIVTVEVPLSAYGSRSSKALYTSLSSHWQASVAEQEIETGMSNYNWWVTSDVLSAEVSPTYETVVDSSPTSYSTSSSSKDLSDGAVVGIVIAVLVFLVILIPLIMWGCTKLGRSEVSQTSSSSLTSPAQQSAESASAPPPSSSPVESEATISPERVEFSERDAEVGSATLQDVEVNVARVEIVVAVPENEDVSSVAKQLPPSAPPATDAESQTSNVENDPIQKEKMDEHNSANEENGSN